MRRRRSRVHGDSLSYSASRATPEASHAAHAAVADRPATVTRSMDATPVQLRPAAIRSLGSTCGNRAVQRALGATQVQRAPEGEARAGQGQRAAMAQARQFEAIEAQMDTQHVQSLTQMEAALQLVGSPAGEQALTSASFGLPASQSVKGWTDDAEEWASGAADTVSSAASTAFDVAADTVSGAASGAVEAVSGAAEWATETVDSGIDAATGAATGAAKAVGGAAAEAEEWVSDAAGSAVNDIADAADTAYDWGQGQVAAGEAFIEDRAERIEEGVESAADWLEDTVGDAAGDVTDAITEVVDEKLAELRQKGESALDKAQQWVDDPVGMAQQRAEQIKERYEGLYDDAAERVEKILNGEIPPEAKELWKQIQEAASDLGKGFMPDINFGDIGAALQTAVTGLVGLGADAANQLATGAATPSSTRITVAAPSTNSVSATDLSQFATKLGAEAGTCSRTVDKQDMQFDDASTDKKILGCQIEISISVTLPEWAEAGSQCADVKTEYNRFKGAIAAHEQGHVTRYQTSWANAHLKAVGKNKDVAEKALATVDTGTETEQTNFDTSTNHGVSSTPSTRIADITCGLIKVPATPPAKP